MQEGKEKGRKAHSRLFHSLLPAFLHFISSRGWMELEPETEDEKRRGWSHNAADIAKELHVTRKFVYTVSVPLPSSGNVHRCLPPPPLPPRVPFYSNDADSETLFPKYSLKIHFYEQTRAIAREEQVGGTQHSRF